MSRFKEKLRKDLEKAKRLESFVIDRINVYFENLIIVFSTVAPHEISIEKVLPRRGTLKVNIKSNLDFVEPKEGYREEIWHEELAREHINLLKQHFKQKKLEGITWRLPKEEWSKDSCIEICSLLTRAISEIEKLTSEKLESYIIHVFYS